MQDQSYLDRQYFIDKYKYNCPYCNRRHLSYTVGGPIGFDWTNNKKCYGYIVECDSCKKMSLHLSWINISVYSERFSIELPFKDKEKEYKLLDELFFYHQPTSFFTIDNRIHKIIRELITEAEGCREMNSLTGASACLRKAIYELLRKEGIGVDVGDYSERIKTLKEKFSSIDPSYFDVLCSIKEMTSDELHEESWEAFDSPILQELLEATKSILYEMYVLPDEKKTRLGSVPKLLEKLKKDKEVSKEIDK